MNKTKQNEIITPKVILVKSKKDIYNCINSLNDHKTIIVNITTLSIENKYRIIDFLSGYIFALKGKREKIEDDIYTFSIK